MLTARRAEDKVSWIIQEKSSLAKDYAENIEVNSHPAETDNLQLNFVFHNTIILYFQEFFLFSMNVIIASILLPANPLPGICPHFGHFRS